MRSIKNFKRKLLDMFSSSDVISHSSQEFCKQTNKKETPTLQNQKEKKINRTEF